MRLKIKWRCDDEDYFCTDDCVYEVKSWQEVLGIIKELESRNTVIEIVRDDIL